MKNAIDKAMHDGITALVEHLHQDYAKGFDEPHDEVAKWMLERNTWEVDTSGRNYWRVTHIDGTSRCATAFVVAKPTKGFKRGDILKAATYKAPATNFKRGNVFDRDFSRVTWAGCH